MGEEFNKSFERKQEVIDAALKEFSEKGYESASLNSILKEAQISKGTFYYHFKNKENLYLYLIGVLIDEKKRFMASKIRPEDFQQDIFSIFKLQTRLGVELALSNPQINDFSKSFTKEKGSKIYEKALERYNFKDHEAMKMLIHGAYMKGEIREDLPKEFVERLIGYLFTHVVELMGTHGIDDYEETINYLIEFMKDGLRKKQE